AGLPTTAACPDFAYAPAASAPVVTRLLDAGAVLIGKTNMDQFATGLVGSRSPYGRLSSIYGSELVSGGSSSGSAVAVASGLVAFALGTDTAGSGRVPAAFNGLVGLKPSRGLLSTRGVVPACASLDCVSILAHTVTDAALVLAVIAQPDGHDPWSRRHVSSTRPRRQVVGLPVTGQAEPDAEASAAWAQARDRAGATWTAVPVDVAPLLEAAPLLYAVWVAERTADLGAIVASEPEGLDATVASIIRGGADLDAVTVFAAMHRLAELRRRVATIWEEVDALLLPTAPMHPTHKQVRADPVAVNERLGRFTNSTNLMDLAALALPGPPRPGGLPFGVSLLAPAGEDRRLLELGAQWLGETDNTPEDHRDVALAVAGAHMSGLPLNAQLTERGARFVRRTLTGPQYRLYELAGYEPRRPGLIRVADGGTNIEVEVWKLAPAALGALLCDVPHPLALGRIELEDGESVVGFVCEGYAARSSEDITEYGGWRSYISAVPT
ncbi:MAG TPA: allophanate hydrolase, partial [Solirubrobacteraceae bacterium]